MDSHIALQDIQKICHERNRSILFTYDRTDSSLWKKQMKKLQNDGFFSSDIEDFLSSIVHAFHESSTKYKGDIFAKEINKELAIDILTLLIHQEMAYGTKFVELGLANTLAKNLISLSSSGARYFANSEWNKNKYTENEKNFEFGKCTWTPITHGTFDRGIVVIDETTITIVWFMDED